VPSKPTPPDVNYPTGKKDVEFWRGIPPGAEAGAARINRPEPIQSEKG
jgi:hypothetical protein